MKKILILLTLFTFAVGQAQYKASISANTVEIKYTDTDLLIRKISNVSGIYPYYLISPKKITLEYGSLSYDLLYDKINYVSIDGGTTYAPIGTFDSFVNQLKSVVVLASSGGGGGAGDASAANQVTANTKLTSIDGKTPALGVATSAASSPVVLASDSSPISVFNSELPITGQASQTAVINNILTTTAGSNAFNATGYKSASIQVVSTGTGGTFIFEGSNDNVNFQAIPVFNNVTLTGTPIVAAVTASASQIIYSLPVRATYIRLRIVSTITGGTIQAFSRFSQESWSPAIYQVAQATAANLNATIGGGTLPTVTTVTTVTGLTTLSNGQTAHSTASTGSPLRAGGRVVPTTIATQDLTLVAGDAGDAPISTGGQLIFKQSATSELDYNFVFSTVGTTVTPQTLVQSSGTASVRNYVKTLRIASDALGAAGNVWILDGALTVSSIATTTGLTTTSVAHDLKVGDAVVFTALAAGTGVTTNTLYYVTAVGSTTTFNFALTPGGSNVIPSVAYTGTTVYRILDQLRFQTTALTPTLITYEEPLRNNPNMAINLLIPTSLTSGNIYLTVNGYRGF